MDCNSKYQIVEFTDEQREQIVKWAGKDLFGTYTRLDLMTAVYDEDNDIYLTLYSSVCRGIIRVGEEWDEYRYLILFHGECTYACTHENGNYILSITIGNPDVEQNDIIKLIRFYKKSKENLSKLGAKVLEKAVIENKGEEIISYKEWFINRNKVGFVSQFLRKNDIYERIGNGKFNEEGWYVDRERGIYVIVYGRRKREYENTADLFRMLYRDEIVYFSCVYNCDIFSLRVGSPEFWSKGYEKVYIHIPSSLMQYRDNIISTLKTLFTSECFDRKWRTTIRSLPIENKCLEYFE